MARAAKKTKKANKPKQRRAIPWHVWWRHGQNVLALGVLVGVVALVVHWALNPANLPIRTVKVEGAFRHLDEQELQRAVGAKVNGGFFGVDIDAIRAAVAERPWVDRVQVRRMWPDRLYIHVTEHEPLARWGDHGLVDVNGVWFGAEQQPFTQSLPQLRGPKGFERQLAQRYRSLRDGLQALGLQPVRLVMTDRRAWQMTLDNGIELRFGRGDVDALVRRFARVYPRVLAESATRIAAVDLRYTNGFAVRWKDGAAQTTEQAGS